MRSLVSFDMLRTNPLNSWNDTLVHADPDQPDSNNNLSLGVVDVHEWKGLTVAIKNASASVGNLTAWLYGIMSPTWWRASGVMVASLPPDNPMYVGLEAPVWIDVQIGINPSDPGALLIAGPVGPIAPGGSDVLAMYPPGTPWFPFVFVGLQFSAASANNAAYARGACYDLLPDAR